MTKKKTSTKPKAAAKQETGDESNLVTKDSSALAARIPFRMIMHTSGDKTHSGRYTNEKLGIGHEYHHPAKNGYVKTGPKVKVKKWFYRESPKDAPCYPTLRELLEADPELRERAEVAYPPNK